MFLEVKLGLMERIAWYLILLPRELLLSLSGVLMSLHLVISYIVSVNICKNNYLHFFRPKPETTHYILLQLMQFHVLLDFYWKHFPARFFSSFCSLCINFICSFHYCWFSLMLFQLFKKKTLLKSTWFVQYSNYALWLLSATCTWHIELHFVQLQYIK